MRKAPCRESTRSQYHPSWRWWNHPTLCVYATLLMMTWAGFVARLIFPHAFSARTYLVQHSNYDSISSIYATPYTYIVIRLYSCVLRLPTLTCSKLMLLAYYAMDLQLENTLLSYILFCYVSYLSKKNVRKWLLVLYSEWREVNGSRRSRPNL